VRPGACPNQCPEQPRSARVDVSVGVAGGVEPRPRRDNCRRVARGSGALHKFTHSATSADGHLFGRAAIDPLPSVGTRRFPGEVMTVSKPDVENSRPGAGGKHARGQLLAATPATERRFILGGISTAVLIGGDGPPIILLHGPGEFSLTWLRVMPELAKTNRVIVPDLPGHGESLLGDAPLGPDRVLTWLGELIEQTSPSPPYLAGHLLGGAVAARFAIAHSELLRGLALVDTFGLRRLRPSPMFGLTLINFLARPTDRSRDRFFRQCFVDMNRLQQQLGPLWEPLMTCALEGANSPDQRVALRNLMPHFGWRAIPEEELARISVPTILIWGRHDRQTPLTLAQRTSSRYQWPLHIIEDAADDPAFEQPEALVNALSIAMPWVDEDLQPTETPDFPH
jgi:pimeloyl-ACP methyl ester carboxylesterase